MLFCIEYTLNRWYVWAIAKNENIMKVMIVGAESLL